MARPVNPTGPFFALFTKIGATLPIMFVRPHHNGGTAPGQRAGTTRRDNAIAITPVSS